MLERHLQVLRMVIGNEPIGSIWIIESDGAPVGYALIAYSYDIEYGGRDAYMNELWIDESWRARGAGREAIELLVPVLKECGVHALHLQVRPENPAVRLYERCGFVTSPRRVMTRYL